MTTTQYCETCLVAIPPDAAIVQGEAIARSGLNLNEEPVLAGGRVFLFHAECWGAGLPGYNEIARGVLSEVQARELMRAPDDHRGDRGSREVESPVGRWLGCR